MHIQIQLEVHADVGSLSHVHACGWSCSSVPTNSDRLGHLHSFPMDFSCCSGPLIKYHLSPHLAPQKSQAWPWKCTSLIRPDTRSGHIQQCLNQMRSHDCPRLPFPLPPRAHHSTQLTLLNPNKS